VPGDGLPHDPFGLKDGIERLLERDRAETDESLERERRITDDTVVSSIESSVTDALDANRDRVDDRVEETRARRDERLAGAGASSAEVADTLEQAADHLAHVAEHLTHAAESLKKSAPPVDETNLAAETVAEVADTLTEVAQRVAEEREIVDTSIREERALLDEVLEQERATSDATLEFERRARRMLFEAERERTDRHLAEERQDTDDAVRHALDLLVNEQASRVDAEQRALTRDEFLAIVSHDLRSPLDAIAINATLLAENAPAGPEAEKHQKWTRNIHRAVDVMARLVSDLLDIARFEGGEFRVAREERDVRAVVKEGADTFAPVATSRNLHLTVDLPPQPVAAWFDHDRVLQVLSNLLRNAIHFTPAGGSIAIGLAADEQGCRISVTDTGIGIPVAQQARIFDRFQQLRSADRRGLGLGLYISKRIIDAHGGRIWVESRPGEGSTFHFTLPGRNGRDDRDDRDE
jgi:signal transduction histidine kinase